MKIYDCFTFYNEFELLELRLRETSDLVDHFVIVEANTTFQNQPKDLLLKQNWARFSQWHDKMRLVTVEDMPGGDPWANERHQRDAIMRGLADADARDIVIIGDVDELLHRNTINYMRDNEHEIYAFRMPLFNFKFNYMLVTQDVYQVWPAAIRYAALDTPENFRRERHALNSFPANFRSPELALIEHAGWHFTYFGNEDFARNKLASFAHAESNRPEILNQLDIEDSINNGVGIIRTNTDYRFAAVEVDNYFPTTIVENIDQYRDRIIESDVSVWNYLPKF